MEHYFTNNSDIKSQIHQFSYTFHGNKFDFISDNGMFSKEHVDYGTDILLKNLPVLSGSLHDLGCGYGVIGVVLAKTYSLPVVFSDVNEKALEYTRYNCDRNQVNGSIISSYCYEKITDSFDNIILNPPIHVGKETIFQMYEEAYAHLNKGGGFYLVIQKKHGAESTLKKLQTLYSEYNILYKKKGFYVIEGKKISN